MFILDGCGDLPGGLIKLISWCFKIIKIGVPIALVIWGMLDFAKATFASKEDEMEKAKKNFIMRIIAGVAVFLVLAITQWVMNIVSVNDADSMAACVADLMNGNVSSGITCPEGYRANGDKCEYVDDGIPITPKLTKTTTTTASDRVKKCRSTFVNKCTTIWKNKSNSNDKEQWCTDLSKSTSSNPLNGLSDLIKNDLENAYNEYLNCIK